MAPNIRPVQEEPAPCNHSQASRVTDRRGKASGDCEGGVDKGGASDSRGTVGELKVAERTEAL